MKYLKYYENIDWEEDWEEEEDIIEEFVIYENTLCVIKNKTYNGLSNNLYIWNIDIREPELLCYDNLKNCKFCKKISIDDDYVIKNINIKKLNWLNKYNERYNLSKNIFQIIKLFRYFFNVCIPTP